MAQASNRSAEQRPLLRDEEADADPSSIDSTTATTKRYAAARTSRYIVFGVSLALIVLLIATGIVVGVRDSRGPPPEDGPEDDIPDYTNLPGPKPGLRNPSYLLTGTHGAVAAEEKRCSEIGLDVLKENGTATDAAIAAALCVGVVNSFSAGIGGGGFMVIRPPTCPSPASVGNGKTHGPCGPPLSIDFRETAPTGSFPEMFAESPALSKIGGLAVGVPGEMRGFEAAYKAAGGGVPWERLFEPSAKLADGFTAGAELERRLPLFGKGWMEEKKEWSDIFLPQGHFVKQGEIVKRPAYAETLRRIGREGPGVFYEGVIAENIVKAVKESGGTMTLADLQDYAAHVKPALVATYRNRTYYTTDAPSGGPVLINLLNTLEGYSLPDTGRTGLQQHRYIEALKFAFSRRTEIGDPAFMNGTERQRISDIQTKAFGVQTRRNITDARTHSIEYYDPLYDILHDHGTTHISAVDSQGSSCALTTTVNLLWGSRVMTSDGIILDDELDDFSSPGVPNAFGLRPSPFNFPLPNKRPQSSTSPAIFDAEDGNVWLTLGGSGGSRIFSAVAQTVLNLDWGYDLTHAIEEPRSHDQLLPATVFLESGYREDLTDALKSRGHNITLVDINLGLSEVQAVLRKSDGRFFAASDSRKNGVAAAY